MNEDTSIASLKEHELSIILLVFRSGKRMVFLAKPYYGKTPNIERGRVALAQCVKSIWSNQGKIYILCACVFVCTTTMRLPPLLSLLLSSLLLLYLNTVMWITMEFLNKFIHQERAMERDREWTVHINIRGIRINTHDTPCKPILLKALEILCRKRCASFWWERQSWANAMECISINRMIRSSCM